MIFSEDRKETILKEMEDASLSVIISGSCSDVNGEKASLLVEKGRNTSKMEENDRNTLLTQITGMYYFVYILPFECQGGLCRHRLGHSLEKSPQFGNFWIKFESPFRRNYVKNIIPK